MPKLNVGSTDQSEDEIDWIAVACNLQGESTRAKIGQIVTSYLLRCKPYYSKKVDYLARKSGLTWEQCFVLLRKKAPPFTEEDIEWAKTQPPLAIKEQELSDFGTEAKSSDEAAEEKKADSSKRSSRTRSKGAESS